MNGFLVGGVAVRQNEQISAIHSSKDPAKYSDVLVEIMSFFIKVVLPKVVKYFAAEFGLIKEYLHNSGIKGIEKILGFAYSRRYYNRMHTDNDCGPTVLVRFRRMSKGGEFVHPMHGVGHVLEAGSIVVVNPSEKHCTA